MKEFRQLTRYSSGFSCIVSVLRLSLEASDQNSAAHG